MAITLRSRREIELMRNTGRVVAEVLSKLQEIAEPGMTTGQLEAVAQRMTAQAGAEALFKGVKNPMAKSPFPACICASINEEVVHGIPSEKIVLREGDILSVDYGARLDGYCGDSAVTIAIGTIDEHKRRLMDITRSVLELAISNSKPGVRWSRVAGRMQNLAESAGFSVVREFVGHGIGREMHEPPRVPNFVSKELIANDFTLEEGMILAVEPMITQGNSKVITQKNGWTVVTKDGKCAAHFEHTIAVGENGCEVLTAVG